MGKQEKENIAKPQKRKRRKRAKTPEEKKQRAIERKIKNRESAMRSRQRMLDQVKNNEMEANKLRKINIAQEERIKLTEKKLSEAEKENARLREELKLLRALQ